MELGSNKGNTIERTQKDTFCIEVEIVLLNFLYSTGIFFAPVEHHRANKYISLKKMKTLKKNILIEK